MGAMKRKLMMLLILVGISQTTSAQTAVEEYGQLNVAGKYIIDKNDNQVQLRGMSFFWSMWKGQYYTYNTVKWLRDDWKCNIVRAAMGVDSASGGYMKSAAVAATEKAKVKAVVDAAIDLGIYVIIDWHTHNGLNASEKNAAIAFFSEMAETYKGHPNVIYEIFNEPLKVSWDDLKVYSEDVIAAIRVHDTANIIVCGTPNWSQDVDAVIGKEITSSKNIAYTLHYYAATHKEFLREKAVKAMDAGLCLMVTEFGTCDATGGDPIDAESSKIWFDFLDEHKISWCNWSVSDKDEAASIITTGTSPAGNWTNNQITTSGKIVREELLFNYYVKNMTATDLPIISSQPVGAKVRLATEYVLTANALSVGDLSYQWFFNADTVKGATASTLTLTDFAETLAGKYHVQISNINGSISTDTVILSLNVRRPYKDVVAIPGTIQAEDFDIGGNGYTYFDTDASNNGAKYRLDEGVDIEASEDKGYQVGWTGINEWLEYTVNVAEAGDYALKLFVAAPVAGGKLEVSFGQYVSSTFTAPSTGSWTKRDSLINKVTLEAGEQVVRLKVLNAVGFNMDKLVVILYSDLPVIPVDPVNATKTETSNFNIYPNPAQDLVTITADEAGTVTIVGSLSTIQSFPVIGTQQYSIKDLAPGAYRFMFQSESGVVTKQIIKL